ncbi:MAG: chemotaxis protein CheW [Alphaproteobacteria bacterium]
MNLLNFYLQGERYGVDLADVDEVLNMAALKPLPGAPDFVAGVLNLRGDLLPVVDLVRRLGVERDAPPEDTAADGSPLAPYRASTRLLVVTADDRRFAVIVDGIEGIQASAPDRFRARVMDGNEVLPFLGDVGLDADGMVQLIRIRKILGPEEFGLLSSAHG